MATTRLQKIQELWPDSRLLALPGITTLEADSPSATDIWDAIEATDPTPKKVYVQWLLNSWEKKKGFLWEDIKTGAQSKVNQTIVDFERLKKKLIRPDGTPDSAARSLMSYSTPGDLWLAVKPFLDKEGLEGESISSRQHKRNIMAKAKLESRHLALDNGVEIDIPYSVFAAKALGRNTKWCTSADKDNAFNEYASTGPVFIVTLPGGTRFQGHYPCDDLFEENLLEALDELGDGTSPDEVADEILANTAYEFMFANEADNTTLTSEEVALLAPYWHDIRETMVSECSKILRSGMEDEANQIYYDAYFQALRGIMDETLEGEREELSPMDEIVEDEVSTVSGESVVETPSAKSQEPTEIQKILTSSIPSIDKFMAINEIVFDKPRYSFEKDIDALRVFYNDNIQIASDALFVGHDKEDVLALGFLETWTAISFMRKFNDHLMPEGIPVRDLDKVLQSVTQGLTSSPPVLEGDEVSLVAAARYDILDYFANNPPGRDDISRYSAHSMQILNALFPMENPRINSSFNDEKWMFEETPYLYSMRALPDEEQYKIWLSIISGDNIGSGMLKSLEETGASKKNIDATGKIFPGIREELEKYQQILQVLANENEDKQLSHHIATAEADLWNLSGYLDSRQEMFDTVTPLMASLEQENKSVPSLT